MAHRFRGRPGGLRSLAAAGSRHQPISRRRWNRNRIVDVGFSSLFTGQTQGSLWLRVRKDAEEIVELESMVWNQTLSPKPGFLANAQTALFR